MNQILMSRERAQQREMEEAVEQGEVNAALIPRLQLWCRHLEVKMYSAGMLAEWTKLPIGLLGIECPHATEGFQAMDLKSVAAYFVSENCRNCPHHDEVEPDNAGREILRETEQVKEEREAARSAAPSAARLRLRGLVSGDISVALKSAPTTEESVLELVALLDDDTHAGEASEKLRQAAELAPEFFSDLACEVISEHMADILAGNNCAAALRIIGRERASFPPVAVVAALKCVELPFCHDEVLELLADYLSSGGEIPHVAVVAKVIGHQAYDPDDFPRRGAVHSPPGQLRLLVEVGRRDIERLSHAFEKRLENPEAPVRFGTSLTFQHLLRELPALGPLLKRSFISSFSYEDARSGRSADVEATRALADIFILDPSGTQETLASAFLLADDEVKELIFRVYRSVLEAARRTGDQALGTSSATRCLPELLDVLIPATTSAATPLEIRKNAAETIKNIARYQPDVALSRVDALLGALAIVSREAVDFVTANPGDDPLLPGFPRSEPRLYDTLESYLASTLKEFADEAPMPLWKAIKPILQTLRAEDKGEAKVKARLLGLFVPLSRNHMVAPELIPELFKGLMNMESVLVRVSALAVIKNLLRRSPELIPDNMREMVVVYLRDQYVAVHRSAAEAASVMPMNSEAQASEVASLIAIQFNLHAQQGGDADHLRELSRGLVRLGREVPEAKVYAHMALVRRCQGTYTYDILEALSDFREFAEGDPARSVQYVEEALKFLTRFPKWEDSQTHSQEHSLFISFFEQPASAILANLSRFRQAVSAAASVAPYEALQLISVLLHSEQYQAAFEAASEIVAALPSGIRHDALRTHAQLTALAAKAESFIASRNPASAVPELQAAESFLGQYETHTNRDRPEAVAEAFSVADSVAKRIK